MPNTYAARELKGMKTIHQTNGAELKVETDTLRVWLEADDRTVTVEKLVDGRWQTTDSYRG